MSDVDAKTLALAEHWLDVGQPARTLEALGRVSGDELHDAEYWELRTRAHVELEQWVEALRAVREGLELDPESLVLLDGAALVHAERGELAAAEEMVLRALRLDADNPYLLCRYAQILHRGNELDKAERVLARAAAIAPDDEAVIQTRVSHEYLRGNDRAAERLSRELLEQDADHPVGHAMLGGLAADRGSFRAARRHTGSAVAYDPAEYGDLARLVRRSTHPLLWPLWPIQRFGPAKVWLAAILTMGILTALDQTFLLGLFVVAYLFLVVYSWVIGPLVVKYLEWRAR